jgi:GTPase Era involved in 16S rRNA processing
MHSELIEKLKKTLNNHQAEINKLGYLLEKKFFTVSVFGKYNHGKSTLLNALLDQNIFEVGDIRTTKELKYFKKNNILWCDTPGLDADIKGLDDKKAYETLYKSDLILIVHSIKDGELDKREMDFIEKNIQKSDINNKNFILILAQKEEVDDEDFMKIKEKIKLQINNKIELISVSSELYSEGLRINNSGMITASNIHSLIEIINKRKNNNSRNIEFEKIKAELINELDKEINKVWAEFSKMEFHEIRLKNSYVADFNLIISELFDIELEELSRKLGV